MSIHFCFWNHNALFVVKSVFILLVKKTNMSNPDWTCNHCLYVQPIRQLGCQKYPSCGTPYSESWWPTAVTWANRYFLNLQSHSKLRRVLPKLVMSWEDSHSTQTWGDYHVYWNDLEIVFVFLYLQVAVLQAHSCLKTWKDVSKGDIKIFLAQLIVMGLVRKTSIESYWNHGEIVRTPYFGTYISQNNFQNILSNFHMW